MTDNIAQEVLEKLPNSCICLNIENCDVIGDAKIHWFNKHARKDFKLTNKSIGTSFKTLIPSVSDSVFTLVFKKLLKTKDSERIISYNYKDKKRKDFYYRVEVLSILDNYLVLAFYDIKAQKLLQDKLSHKIEELETLNKYMVDRELNMIELKKQLEDCSDYGQKLQGCDCEDGMHQTLKED